MKTYKKFFSFLSLVCFILCFFSSVTVKAGENSENGITITQNADGTFKIATDDKSKDVYFAYKIGSDVSNLEYPKFNSNLPIKYYSLDGKCINTIQNGKDVAMFNDTDKQYWSHLGADVKTLEGTDFYNDERCIKVIETSRGTNVDSGNIRIEGLTSTTKVQILACIKNSDGSYSNIISKTFDWNKKSVEQTNTPQIIVSTVEKTDDYVKVHISMSLKNTDDSLYSLMIASPSKTETTVLNGNVAEADYTIQCNGKHVFTVISKTGRSSSYTVDQTGLSGLGVSGESSNLDTQFDASDVNPPVLSFSGMPSSIDFGSSFNLHVSSNEVCTISIDGKVYADIKDVDYEVFRNGTYTFSVTDKGGNEADYNFEVTCFPSSQDVYENQGHHLDLKNYWNGLLDKNGLPQTGGITLAVIVVLGVVGTGVGVKLIKGKSTKGVK